MNNQEKMGRQIERQKKQITKLKLQQRELVSALRTARNFVNWEGAELQSKAEEALRIFKLCSKALKEPSKQIAKENEEQQNA